MLLEIHSHTHHSHGTKIYYDGVAKPEALVASAAKKGLDAISVTDHNTIQGGLECKQFEKKYGVMVIPGEEVSSSDGHILAIGIQETIPKGMSVPETVDAIHDQGGIAISSHPFDISMNGLGKLSKQCDAIEVFNSINFDRLSNRNARQWAKQQNLVGVASSDAHTPEMVGHGVTEVLTDSQNLDSILKAIRNGKVKLHTKYTPMPVLGRWTVTRFQMSYDYTLNYILNNYSGPKKLLSKWGIGLTQKSPGKIDNLFKIMSYMGLFGAMTYSAIWELRGGKY